MGGGCSGCGAGPGVAPMTAPGTAPNVAPGPATGQPGAQSTVPPTTMYNPTPTMQVTPAAMMDARNTMVPARY
jgi:hypothetical protein